LREVCDAYALDRLVKIKEELVFEGKMTSPTFLPSVHPTVVLLWKYVTRALLDGSPAAAGLFDDMVDMTEQWIDKFELNVPDDKRAFAAILVGMQTGLLAMHEHVSRAMGIDVFTTQGHLRMTGALVDFYTRPLIDDELTAKVRAMSDAMRASNPPSAT